MALYIKSPDSNGQCCECSTRPNPCDTCGGVEGTCSLVIPVFSGPFDSYAEAFDVFDLNVAYQRAQCYAYFDSDPSSTITLLSASLGSNTLLLNATVTDFPAIQTLWACVTVEEGTTLNFDYFGNINTAAIDYNLSVDIRNEAGTVVHSHDEASQVGDFNITNIAAGTYYIEIGYTALAMGPLSANLDCDITATVGSMVVNPVVAEWDDSGTTRILEKCPKLFLPILTESTGSWYADEATAQSVIDNETSNCVGYAETPFPNVSFTATNGGTQLTLDAESASSGTTASVILYGSVNVLGGETIACAYSIVETGPGVFTFDGIVRFRVYDYEGNQVFEDTVYYTGSTSGTFTYSPVAFSGRYTVRCFASSRQHPSGSKTVDANFVITSSGTLSVNQVQALYDTGLDCPARLDC